MRQKTLFAIIVCNPLLAWAQKQLLPTKQDTAQTLQEIVISASRTSEKLQQAPVSIGVLTQQQTIQMTTPSFFDAMGNLKGVQTIVPSMGFKIINTRGFANTTNVRFVQMVDNTDNQSPHIGAPIANALCPSNLDIDHVEIVQGAASALYGMNAVNGLANILTKNPFTTQGFSIEQQTGINHVNDANIPTQVYTETSVRWAKKIAPKWAFKINVGLNKGYDWIADNNTDITPNLNASANLQGANNPGYDGINVYGNESSDRKTLTLAGKNYVVARTGYHEKDVTDYHLQNWKGDVGLFYQPTPHSTLSYTYRTALLNSVYQRANRFSLKNYALQQHLIQYKSTYVQARAYVTSENTGDSYNLRSMAENLDLAFKSNTKWYADYTNAFKNAISTNDVATAHHLARAAADNGRLQPHTTAFNNQLQTLQQINNWDVGAALKVKAKLWHTEASVDAGKLLHTSFKWQIGSDARDYAIVPDGNYFINPTDSGQNLHYRNWGVWSHVSHVFWNNRLQLSAALRASQYTYFGVKWNPRLTAVYTINCNSTVRVSYQVGNRFPSIFEGFSNINSGGVKRVGGLRVMSNGIFENLWLKSSIDAFQTAVNKAVNTGGQSQAAAIESNKNILQHSNYTYLQPEQMQSFEIGYRSTTAQNRLSIDADAYYNVYEHFIAQIEGSVANTQDAAQIPTYLFDKTKQNRYRLWTNSASVVHNYGAALALQYLLTQHYALLANATYQNLAKTNQNDGLEDGFNTPNWIINWGITATDVYKNLGFSLQLQYLSSYYWQSFLVNGQVSAVATANAAIQYHIAHPAINLKLGATNLFNQYYNSILGGPQIGGLYYTAITYTVH